ncbi:hypothetical protein ACP70R_008300 [Stipagrostis hirtigluma subsp. patula]
MEVLHCCIKETLRMHPPSPILIRKVHKNFTVRTKEGTEYEVPRGHTIASPTLFNHNISDIYKDPEVYDPAGLVLEGRRIKLVASSHTQHLVVEDTPALARLWPICRSS